MVSTRCKELVRTELKAMGLHFVVVDLGQVDIMEELTPSEISQLSKRLLLSGLFLMPDKKALLIQRIIDAVRCLVHEDEAPAKIRFSDYITTRINEEYLTLSALFAEVKGITLLQYVLVQKISRIKELLFHKKHTLSEIAFKMNYSSVAHLCTQFKKVTGQTPGAFMSIKVFPAHLIEK
jgi:AraC-like DNA-binding protein